MSNIFVETKFKCLQAQLQLKFIRTYPTKYEYLIKTNPNVRITIEILEEDNNA